MQQHTNNDPQSAVTRHGQCAPRVQRAITVATDNPYHEDTLRDGPMQQHHRHRKWNAVLQRDGNEIRRSLDALWEGNAERFTVGLVASPFVAHEDARKQCVERQIEGRNEELCEVGEENVRVKSPITLSEQFIRISYGILLAAWNIKLTGALGRKLTRVKKLSSPRPRRESDLKSVRAFSDTRVCNPKIKNVVPVAKRRTQLCENLSADIFR